MTRSLALLTLTFTLAPAVGQEPKPAPELPPWGTEVFRGLLSFSGCTPYHGFDRNRPTNNSEYRGVIVIVSGKIRDDEPVREAEIRDFIRRCVQSGGSVLIASRDAYDLSRLLPDPVEYRVTSPGLRFFGESHTPESLPDDQKPDCPIVSPLPFGLGAFLRTDPSTEKNPFKGLPRVATYRPACLVPTVNAPKTFIPLAWLPPGCVVEKRGGRSLPSNALFAVGYDTQERVNGSGKLIVMADERVLSNQMIALPGTDNLPFALKLISVLKGPDSMNRNKVIFVENGRYKDSFDDVKFNVNPTPPLPIPPPQVIDQLGTQLADAAVDQVDKTDAINGLISKNQEFYARMIALLILILSGLAALMLAFRSLKARHAPDRRAMPVAPLARVRPAKGLVGQMRQDVIVAGDFGPLVREYCVELFTACGLPAGAHDRLPPVSYKGRAENTPALLADLTKLWATTYGPPSKITLATWKDLEPMLHRVWRAAEAGRWSFAPAGAT